MVIWYITIGNSPRVVPAGTGLGVKFPTIAIYFARFFFRASFRERAIDLSSFGGSRAYLRPVFHYSADLANLWHVMVRGDGIRKFSCPCCIGNSAAIKDGDAAAAATLPERMGHVLGIPYGNVHFDPLHALMRITEKLLKLLAQMTVNKTLQVPSNVSNKVRWEKETRQRLLAQFEALVVTATQRETFFVEFKTREQLRREVDRNAYVDDDPNSATGKTNVSTFVSCPTLTGVQAARLLGWVYARADKKYAHCEWQDGAPPYIPILEHVVGSCRCEQLLREQQQDIHTGQSQAAQIPFHVPGSMTELPDDPFHVPGSMTELPDDSLSPRYNLWRGRVDPVTDADATALIAALGILFENDHRVTWARTADGELLRLENGLALPIDSAICERCHLQKLFEVFAPDIFTAMMPTVPEFLRRPGTEAIIPFQSVEANPS